MTPVCTEIHGLHLNGVRPELTGTRDKLDTLVVDPARIGLIPLDVAVAPGLLHAGATVEERGRDGFAVDHDDEVEEVVARALGLEARDGSVLASTLDGGIHIGWINARPGLDHFDLVRERREPSVDEVEGLLRIYPGR